MHRFNARYVAIVVGALASGAAAMVYQFAVVTGLSFVLGSGAVLFAVFTGLYLTAMGVGCLAAARLQSDPETGFLRSQSALAALGFASLPALFLLHALVERFAPGGSEGRSGLLDACLWAWGLAVDAGFGLLVGLQIPLLASIAPGPGADAPPIARLLGFEYLGSFAGALLFPLVMFPRLGLFRAAFAAALVNAGAALLGAAALGGAPRRRDTAVAALLLAAVGTSMAGADALERTLQALVDGRP